MRGVALILLALIVVSCGRADKPLIGAWERTITTRTGDLDRQVLEFFDGGQVLLQTAYGEVGAKFKGTGKVITLKGPLARAWPGKITYKIASNVLAIDRASPQGDHTEWARIKKPPLFALKTSHGQVVPTDMPAFLASITSKIDHHWHQDAVATSIAATRRPAGDYAMLVSFYSASDGTALRAAVTRWAITTTPVRAASSTPLPANFTDLPEVISHERNHGNKGTLVNAALVGAEKKPFWVVTTLAGTRGTTDFYSAKSGSEMKPAELAQIAGAAGLGAAIGGAGAPVPAMMNNGSAPTNFAPSSADVFSEDSGSSGSSFNSNSDSGSSSAQPENNASSNNGYSGEPAPGEPLPNGDTCYYSTYAACNAAANGDTWAADRIENGTASGSEQDWYGGAGTANEENTQQPENNEQPSSEPEQQPEYQPPQENTEPSYQPEPEPEPSYQPEPEPQPSYEPPPEPSYEPPPSNEGSSE